MKIQTKLLPFTGKLMKIDNNSDFSTHGFNRTGLVIVSYLCRIAKLSLTEALKEFSYSRQNIGIYREKIIAELYKQYAKEGEVHPVCPKEPAWARSE